MPVNAPRAHQAAIAGDVSLPHSFPFIKYIAFALIYYSLDMSYRFMLKDKCNGKEIFSITSQTTQREWMGILYILWFLRSKSKFKYKMLLTITLLNLQLFILYYFRKPVIILKALANMYPIS